MADHDQRRILQAVVAEAAKLALGEENILERVFIVELLNGCQQTQPDCRRGRFLRSRKQSLHHQSKAMMVACGGAVNIYQPRSMGEGKGRAWYPVWNSGSTYTMACEAVPSCP
jgi:adenylylsulfate reductase, subunit A